MEKKKLLFNYFVMKCIQKERELHGIQDFGAALLSLVLSDNWFPYRYSSAYTERRVCFCQRDYLFELLACVCEVAYAKGNSLSSVFKIEQHFAYPNRFVAYETDLDSYLIELLPSVRSFDELDLPTYQNLLKVSREKMIELACHPSNLCRVDVLALELPEESEETKVIDEAWEVLTRQIGFDKLFDIAGKYKSSGENRASIFRKKTLSHL